MRIGGNDFPEGTIYNLGQGTFHGTIQEAIDEAEAGDTILVGAGTYPGNVTINPVNGLTLKSATEHGAVIEGTITVYAAVTIDGFYISDDSAGISFPAPGGEFKVNIINNIIDGPGWEVSGQGIRTGSYEGPIDATIENNIIKNWRTGIYLHTYDGDWLVNNNVFDSNRSGVAMNVEVGSFAFTNNEVKSQVSGLSIAGPVPVDLVESITGNTFKDTYLGLGERYFTDRRYSDETDTDPVPYIDDVIANNTFDAYEKYWDAGGTAWLIRVPE